jgi:transporter family protein
MAWLQQFWALPFMALILPFATVYNPLELSSQFYSVIIIATTLGALDLILYFKAIQTGDISVIAPLISITAVSSIIGSYFILGQEITIYGAIGASLILLGAFLSSKNRTKSKTAVNNILAISLILIVVLIRGVNSPLEVLALRETNPIFYNFASSILLVPTIMLIMFISQKLSGKQHYGKQLNLQITKHRKALIFIGLTMTLNLFLTYTAKDTSPNAGYVTAVKGSQVLPMVLIGALVFKEKVTKKQWLGVLSILCGLIAFSFT